MMTTRLEVGTRVEIEVYGRRKQPPYAMYYGPRKRVGVVVYSGPRFAVLDFGPYREAFQWDDLMARMKLVRRK
jgi:hypothetical protein